MISNQVASILKLFCRVVLILAFAFKVEYGAAECLKYGTPTQIGKLKKALDEVSGIVASRRQPGVFWAHNDSLNKFRLHAFRVVSNSVQALGYFKVSGINLGVHAMDWEDIAIGPGPTSEDWIYIADTGNNFFDRNSGRKRALRLIRVPEPRINYNQIKFSDDYEKIGETDKGAAEVLAFSYPNGIEYDSESIAISKSHNLLYLVTKGTQDDTGADVFEFSLRDSHWISLKNYDIDLPRKMSPRFVMRVRDVETVTGMDIAADETMLVLRDKSRLYPYRKTAVEPFSHFWLHPLNSVKMDEEKGEAVAFDGKNKTLFSSSEDSRQVFEVPCLLSQDH